MRLFSIWIAHSTPRKQKEKQPVFFSVICFIKSMFTPFNLPFLPTLKTIKNNPLLQLRMLIWEQVLWKLYILFCRMSIKLRKLQSFPSQNQMGTYLPFIKIRGIIHIISTGNSCIVQKNCWGWERAKILDLSQNQKKEKWSSCQMMSKYLKKRRLN